MWMKLPICALVVAATFFHGAHAVNVPDEYITEEDVLKLWDLVQKEGVQANTRNLTRTATRPTIITEKETYNEAMAQHALHYSELAYCDDIEDCDYMDTPYAMSKGTELEDVTKVFDNATENQAFVGYNTAQDQVIVMFRGTKTLANWINNLNLSLCSTSFHPIATNAKPVNMSEPVGVHCGFIRAFRNLMREGVLAATLKLLYLHPTSSLLLTGHSLGGSLAVLAATEFAGITTEALPLSRQNRILTYTFAAAPVGGTDFAEYFHANVGPRLSASYRVVYGKDPIPNFPISKPDRQYQHIGTEVWYLASSSRDERHDSRTSISVRSVDSLRNKRRLSSTSTQISFERKRSLRSMAVKLYTVCDGSGTDPECSISVPALDTYLNWRHHELYSYVAALYA